MEKRDKDKKKMSDEERENMKKLMTNENDDGQIKDKWRNRLRISGKDDKKLQSLLKHWEYW